MLNTQLIENVVRIVRCRLEFLMFGGGWGQMRCGGNHSKIMWQGPKRWIGRTSATAFFLAANDRVRHISRPVSLACANQNRQG